MDLLFLLKIYLGLGSLVYAMNLFFAIKRVITRKPKVMKEIKGEQKHDER
mgnify:CR=1 FL=1